MNAYGKYQKTRNASWHCLLDCGVSKLPVHVSSIANQFDIGLYEYGDNAALLCRRGMGFLLSAEGFAYHDPSGRLMIFFDECKSRQQIRFTIAHELGHIFLGHVGPEFPRGRHLNPSEPSLERAADMFAVRLLAPSCVLWDLQLHKAEDIATLCDIPISIAQNRARRMSTLYRRESEFLSAGQPSCFLRSPLEQKVHAAFSSFVATRPA